MPFQSRTSSAYPARVLPFGCATTPRRSSGGGRASGHPGVVCGRLATAPAVPTPRSSSRVNHARRCLPHPRLKIQETRLVSAGSAAATAPATAPTSAHGVMSHGSVGTCPRHTGCNLDRVGSGRGRGRGDRSGTGRRRPASSNGSSPNLPQIPLSAVSAAQCQASSTRGDLEVGVS